jgi:polar amino acid transport system substrate-binding protein
LPSKWNRVLKMMKLTACQSMAGFLYAAVLLLSASTVLANSKTIELVTTNWKPYFFEEGEKQGVLTDIVRESLLISGYSLKVTFTSWARAYKGAVEEKYMGILGAYYTDKRAKLFDYSSPILMAEEMLFTLSSKANVRYKTLEDLKEFKIGYMISASHGQAFDKADYLIKVPAADYERNIDRLLSGGIDIFVGGYSPVMHLIDESYPDHKTKIVPILPALAKEKLYLVLRKNATSLEKIDAFNKGLSSLKVSGKYLEILRHHGLEK